MNQNCKKKKNYVVFTVSIFRNLTKSTNNFGHTTTHVLHTAPNLSTLVLPRISRRAFGARTRIFLNPSYLKSIRVRYSGVSVAGAYAGGLKLCNCMVTNLPPTTSVILRTNSIPRLWSRLRHEITDAPKGVWC